MNRRLVVAWGKGGMSIGGGAQRGVAGLGVSRGFGMGYGMGWVEGIVVTGANGGGGFGAIWGAAEGGFH